MLRSALSRLLLSESEKQVKAENCILYESDFKSNLPNKYCWISPDKQSCPSAGKLKTGCCPKNGIHRNKLFQEFTKNRSWKGLEEVLQDFEEQ